MNRGSNSLIRFDRADYNRDGFYHLRGLFRKASVENIRRDAKRVFLAQMEKKIARLPSRLKETGFERALFKYFKMDLPGFIDCANQCQHLMSLHALGCEPRLLRILKNLDFNIPVLSKNPTLYFNSRYLASRERYWRQREHQDWRFLQGSLDSVVLWVPLVDINVPLGALEVLPGSHLSGLYNSDPSEGYGRISPKLLGRAKFTPVTMRQGDALLFSTFLVHRSGKNVTRSIRWSAHFRYSNLEEPTFIERRYPHTYTYQPTFDLLTKNFPPADRVRAIFASPKASSRP